MSVLVVLDFSVRPEMLDDFKASLPVILPDTRAREGCEWVTAHQNQDDPNEVTLVERWGSRAHYEAYLAWRVERGDMENLAKLVTAPPRIRYFDDVAS
jgi:quinol monooxygenase YgiN